jgi:hypothetical protein
VLFEQQQTQSPTAAPTAAPTGLAVEPGQWHVQHTS